MKTLKYMGNVVSAPISALDKMQAEGAEFITWINSFDNTRFVATLNYVSVMASNKVVGWRNAAELPKNEIRNLGMDLCTDEILFEMMAHDVEEIEIKQGFGSTINVSIDDLDVCANIKNAEKELASIEQTKQQSENQMCISMILTIDQIEREVSELSGTWVKRRNLREKLIKQSNAEVNAMIQELKKEIRRLKAGGAREKSLAEVYAKVTRLEMKLL